MLGRGDGTFRSAQIHRIGNVPALIAVGDFNNENNLDIVTANNGDNDVGILLGDGKGSFSDVQTYGGVFGPIFVTVGDLNDDNKLDLVVVSVLLQLFKLYL